MRKSYAASRVDVRALTFAFATVLLVSWGCGGDPGPELAPVPSTPPTLGIEVGTGQFEYQPLSDGDSVDLIYGKQGGWHVWTAVKIRDVTVQDVRINLYARFDDGTEAGDPSSLAASLLPPKDGARFHSAMRNLIHDPIQARGRRIVLRIEVIANDGRHGEGERVVVGR